MPKALDITGKRFGYLTALEKAPSRNGKTYWKCRCDCGNEKEVQTTHLTSKATTSCGDFKCPYHYNPFKPLEDEVNRICEICGKEFVTDNIGRKYCFDCSPSYSNKDPASLTYSKMTLRKAMRAEIIKRHGGKCARCGYDKCIDAFNFHHRDPNEKDFNVSMAGTMRSWQEYLQEAEKCDLLCANCHAEVHYELNQQKKNNGE